MFGRRKGLAYGLIALAVVFAVALFRFWPKPAQVRGTYPSAPITIPFEIVGDHLVVTALLNGAPVKAVLDNGAPGAVIDTAYAAAHGVRGLLFPQGQISLAGETIPFFRAMDLTVPMQENGAPVIIGASGFFDRQIVEVDFVKRQIVLRSRVGFAPPPNALPIPLQRGRLGLGRHYYAPVSVNGHAPTLALVDLGAATPFGGSDRYAKGQDVALIPGLTFSYGDLYGGVQGIRAFARVRRMLPCPSSAIAAKFIGRWRDGSCFG